MINVMQRIFFKKYMTCDVVVLVRLVEDGWML